MRDDQLRQWWAALEPDTREKLRANPEDGARLMEGLVEIWPMTELGRSQPAPDLGGLQRDVVDFIKRQ